MAQAGGFERADRRHTVPLCLGNRPLRVSIGKQLDRKARTAPAVLLRVGRRRGCLPDNGDLRERTHGLFVALPSDPQRVRMGAGRDRRRVLVRLHRLCRAEPAARPGHGPSWASLRHGGRRCRHGCGPATCDLRERALACLPDAGPVGRRGHDVHRLHRPSTISAELVCAAPGARDEHRLRRSRVRLRS